MKAFATLLLLLTTCLSFPQEMSLPERPKVDERVELLSIVFRLAGNYEYSSEKFKLYTDRIRKHYEPYKDHELIQFAKQLKEENGVGFDAVMSMAVHLTEELDPKVEFSETVPDNRWGKANAERFINLLKQFYLDTNSEKFFSMNKSLYEEASNRFLSVYQELDLDWYKDFYGKEPNEKFVIINAMGNGGGNYGPHIDLPDGKRKVYAIMGTWNTDNTGMPVYTLESHFPTLLHEFNHSFVNYLLNQDPAPFRENGEMIHATVSEKMRRGGYSNWQTMLNEALVRAAVIKYMKDHNFPENEISRELTEQINRGFIWIEELLAELERYDEQREKYPTLESYMPELQKAYDSFALNIDNLAEKAEKEKARFHSLGEFKNGDENVDPALSKLSIHFDKVFAGSNFIRPSENGKEFPDFRNMTYSEDGKTVIMDWVLKSDTEYEFVLIGLAPGAAEKDVKIHFKTR